MTVASPPAFDTLREVAARAQIHHVGVAPATIMERARAVLHERRDAGLHAGMQFTYRNPERSTDPTVAVPGALSVIVGARSHVMNLPESKVSASAAPAAPMARVARYSWLDHYAPLRAGLDEVARLLRAAGHRAQVFADDNAIVDREIAYRAGLGWFGKSANLLVPGAGSYFVLGCVITTADYSAHFTDPVADGCGACRRCLDQCPTEAIVSPGVVDANRCLAWLLQRPGVFPERYRQALGDRIYGCDACQEACPPTVRYESRVAAETIDARRADPRSAHRAADRAGDPAKADESGVESEPDPEPEPWVDLTALLTADDEELLRRFGRWYIAERDPRWLRRNALVVLGNVGDGDSATVRDCLQRYADGDDELLAEHARWAQREIVRRTALGATPGTTPGTTLAGSPAGGS